MTDHWRYFLSAPTTSIIASRSSWARRTSSTITPTRPAAGTTYGTGGTDSATSAYRCSGGQGATDPETICSSWSGTPMATSSSCPRNWKRWRRSRNRASGRTLNTRSTIGAARGCGVEEIRSVLHRDEIQVRSTGDELQDKEPVACRLHKVQPPSRHHHSSPLFVTPLALATDVSAPPRACLPPNRSCNRR